LGWGRVPVSSQVGEKKGSEFSGIIIQILLKSRVVISHLLTLIGRVMLISCGVLYTVLSIVLIIVSSFTNSMQQPLRSDAIRLQLQLLQKYGIYIHTQSLINIVSSLIIFLKVMALI